MRFEAIPVPDRMRELYREHRESTDYPVKFNFFSGDEASASLGFPTYGSGEMEGFSYARFLAFEGGGRLG